MKVSSYPRAGSTKLRYTMHSGRSVVGFDMDGVVAHNHHILEAALQKASGRDIRWQEWSAYDYFRDYGLTIEAFLELCIESRSLEDARPEPGISEAFANLRAAAHEIAVITARSFHPEGEAVTLRWLAQQNAEPDHMVLVHPSETKVEALARFPEMVAYVDDHVGHLDGSRLARLPPALFLRDQPWNQHSDAYRRVLTLEDFVESVLDSHTPAPRRSTRPT